MSTLKAWVSQLGVVVVMMLVVSVGLLGGSSVSAQKPKRVATHLNVNPSQMVALEASGSTTNNFQTFDISSNSNDGFFEPFVLTAGTALVVTDVQCTVNTTALTPGVYIGRVTPTGASFPPRGPELACNIDTATEGFEKTISLTSGVVFRVEPQLVVSVPTPAPYGMKLFGYLVRDQ